MRSGDFLWAALHRAGLADRPSSRRADDGLTLTDVYIAAAVRCAPPANKPTPEERDTCAPYLAREIGLLPTRPGHRRARAFGWDGGPARAGRRSGMRTAAAAAGRGSGTAPR